MSSLLVILIGTVLVNAFLLMQNDEALGGNRHSGSIANAIRIGGATSVVLILSAMGGDQLWRPFKSMPNDSLLFVYAITVVTISVAIDRIARSRFPRLARALATSPLLVVSNALALGTGLLGMMSHSAVEIILSAIALGISFIAALALFVALVSRIAIREVPAAFRSAPIALVSAGLLTLALMGFTGLFRG